MLLKSAIARLHHGHRCYSDGPSGFTMLELMITMVILGILALVAVPNMIAQTGKSREVEGKLAINAIGRAQQAYFFENQSFADRMSKLDVTVTGKYYTFPDPVFFTPTLVKHDANPINATGNNIRGYEIAIFFNSNQTYTNVVCQSDTPSSAAEAPNNPSDDCIAGVKIE